MGDEGHTGVEAEAGFLGDEGALTEAGVLCGIGDDEEVGLEDGVGAEGIFSRGMLDLCAGFGFEPLSVLVDEGDEGDGGLADLGCQLGEGIEFGFRGCIEDGEVPEDFEAVFFVGREGWHISGPFGGRP